MTRLFNGEGHYIYKANGPRSPDLVQNPNARGFATENWERRDARGRRGPGVGYPPLRLRWVLGLERGAPRRARPRAKAAARVCCLPAAGPREPQVLVGPVLGELGTRGQPAPRTPGPQLLQAVLRSEGLRWCPLGAPGRLPEEFAPTAPCPRQVTKWAAQKFRVPGAEAHPSTPQDQINEERTPKARGGGASSGSPSRDVLVTSHSKRVFYSFTFSQPSQYTSLPL